MMPQMDFFPQRPAVHPMIYAYRDLNPDYDGLLKVGYTEKDVDRRVAQQYPTKRPDGKLPYEILYRSSAMREDFVPPSWIRRTVHRNSSGMPKCASAKPSPPMSWPNEWG